MNATETPQEYYLRQSVLTDPGPYGFLFDEMPDDLEVMKRSVRGIYLHFRKGPRYGYEIPPARRHEPDLRHVEAILARTYSLDPRPLFEPRSGAHRFVGCCRDAAMVMCSMLRHKGIPARIRLGFTTYHEEKWTDDGRPFNQDHVITEYWRDGAWRLIDTSDLPHIEFDTTDLSRDKFLVGGRVWQLCRRGEVDPTHFGHGYGDGFSSWWALRDNLVRDLAAQNKVEVLLWDVWGWMHETFTPSEDDLALLDRLAALTQGGDATWNEIRALYRDDRFRAPDRVTLFSPVAPPREVDWRRPPRLDFDEPRPLRPASPTPIALTTL
ncbi:MAG: transglutaminase domain-containing protein [Acidobacteriota bacterium]